VSDPRTRFTRALLLATAAVALVALVAVAAGGYRLGGSNSTHASPYAVDVILTVVIALYLVAAIGVVVVMFWSGLELRRIPRQQTKRERTVRTVAILVGMAILITVAANRYHWRVHPHPPTQQAQAGSGKGSGKHTKGSHGKAKQQPQLRVAPFLAVLGAAGVAFAAFVIAERRRRRRLPKDWGVAEVLSDVLDETLDDLRAEPDPRRAVIAAYARMERSLAAHGIPRRRFEAPHEYLTRVLSEVSGGRLAATRLTALFERARFSPHEVDENMKASAIEAIESLQADLAAAELEEAAA
jgi:beta-lactamase regulating signal transducer with metallopeptidase domain